MAVADVEAAREARAVAAEIRLACGRERWRARKEQARARRAVSRAHEIQPRLDDFVEMVDNEDLLDVLVEIGDVDREVPSSSVGYRPVV